MPVPLSMNPFFRLNGLVAEQRIACGCKPHTHRVNNVGASPTQSTMTANKNNHIKAHRELRKVLYNGLKFNKKSGRCKICEIQLHSHTIGSLRDCMAKLPQLSPSNILPFGSLSYIIKVCRCDVIGSITIFQIVCTSSNLVSCSSQ